MRFISRAARFPSSGKGPAARLISSTSGCTFTAAIFCSGIRRCRWVRWRPRNAWSSCALWRTGFVSASWKRRTSSWVWITRRIWEGCPGSCAFWRTGFVSASWKRSTSRWVWIRRRIWKGCPGCSTLQSYREGEMAKYIFVTGGVVSSLGKGIAAASIGCLLESRGLKVTCQKFDPYLNVDPGTMSPFQHGEVFVTDDGAETDLDLGHYERFTHSRLTQSNNLTSGRIYEQIIARERRGDYLGKTVQVIPHVTNEIKAALKKVSGDVDVVIAEIGGTVGDIESLPFLEAIRQMRHEEGRDNCLFIHVTLVPWIAAAQELKTKPTQHSVKELRALGIQPDILLCRCERFIPQEMKEKIALFCDVDVRAVITARDVKSVYAVPVGVAAAGGWGRPRRGWTKSSSASSSSTRARAISPNGRPCWSAWTTRAARSRSPWWASTWNTKTPIRASRKRCCMAAWRTN